MIPNEYVTPSGVNIDSAFIISKSKLKSDIKVSYTIDKIILIVYNMDYAKNYF